MIWEVDALQGKQETLSIGKRLIKKKKIDTAMSKYINEYENDYRYEQFPPPESSIKPWTKKLSSWQDW